MTFEFAPGWMETLLGSSDLSSPAMGMPPLAPPAHPNPREVAALVGELFAEGTLSAEQFRTLLAAPELEPYRDATSQPLPRAS